MKISHYIWLLVSFVALAGCDQAQPLPRERALFIAGEIVAQDRVGLALAEEPTNAPPVFVEEVFSVPTRPDLAVVVCRDGDMYQGWGMLIDHHCDPIDKLASFNSGQYTMIREVRTHPTDDGVIIRVSYMTGRGNDVGEEELLVPPDNSIRWLQTVDLP